MRYSFRRRSAPRSRSPDRRSGPRDRARRAGQPRAGAACQRRREGHRGLSGRGRASTCELHAQARVRALPRCRRTPHRSRSTRTSARWRSCSQQARRDDKAGRHLRAATSAPLFRRCWPASSAAPTARQLQRGRHGRESRSAVKLHGQRPLSRTRSRSSTMPPQVLSALPQLPHELEYRFIGRTLDPARHPRAHHRRLHRRAPCRGRAGGLPCARVGSSPVCTRSPCWLALAPTSARPAHRRSAGACPAGAAAAQKPPRSRCPTAKARSSSPCSATSAPATASSISSASRWRSCARRFPFELVDHRRRQHLRRRSGRRTSQRKFEGPTRPCSTPASSSTRRSAITTSASRARYELFNMDGRTYYTFKAPKRGRPVLRPRERLPDPGADGVAREGAAERRREMEDSLLPSSAVLVGRAARLGRRAARRFSSRSSSKHGVRSCSPATITSTSGSSRRRASSISWRVRAASCGAGNIDSRTGLTAVGYDADQAFMAVEIDGDELFFNTIYAHRRGHRLGRHRAAEASSLSRRLLLRPSLRRSSLARPSPAPCRRCRPSRPRTPTASSSRCGSR